MFFSKANRFRFGPKILVRSKAVWFGLEIVLGKTFWFGQLIIGTKAKRFDLVRLLSERKQNNLICSENYLCNTIWHRALLQRILLAVERDTYAWPPADRSFAFVIPANNIQYRKIPAKNHSLGMFPSTVPPRLLNIVFPAPPIAALLILPTK